MSSSSREGESAYTYGGQQCSAITQYGVQCECKSYFLQNGLPYCGKHSSREIRLALPAGSRKRPSIPDHVWEVASQNVINHAKGRIICTRMVMRRPVPEKEGYLKVFPNHGHQYRKDGFCCTSLSPISLGPVYHFGMSATCLENFWQGSKYFSFETQHDYETKRDELFADPQGRTHKYGKDDKPIYAIFLNSRGEPQQYDNLNSRYFYCRLYEQLASRDRNLRKLREMRDEGVNLQICGYDASDIVNSWDSYLDTSKPFSYESVLYCLLMRCYPWNRYKDEHPEQNYP